MSARRSMTDTMYVVVITALLFVVLAYSPAISEAEARDCGFQRFSQTWINCQDHSYRIFGAWFEGATYGTGNFGACVRPGKTYLYKVVPFGTLAVSAYTNGVRC